MEALSFFSLAPNDDAYLHFQGWFFLSSLPPSLPPFLPSFFPSFLPLFLCLSLLILDSTTTNILVNPLPTCVSLSVDNFPEVGQRVDPL